MALNSGQAHAQGTVSVAVVAEPDLVASGLMSMLSPYEHLVRVRNPFLADRPPELSVDLALFDTQGLVTHETTRELQGLARLGSVGRVAVFSLAITDAVIEHARTAGAAGVISKGLSSEALAMAVHQAGRSDDFVVAVAESQPLQGVEPDWPGQEDELTARESEIAVLAAQGLTNAEIGGLLFIGRETVKTHFSQVLHKLGVKNRVALVRHVLRDWSSPGPR